MHRKGVIVATASPAGACARIVIRVSGEGCHALLSALFPGGVLLPRGVELRPLCVSGLSFPVSLFTLAAGASYTGEESAEVHLPGNPLLAGMVLAELQSQGARPAEAGEFTARAFFNGRMNLTEVEGVAATITATNERELRAARRLQHGALAAALRPVMDELTQSLALLEAGIDFAEEDIRFISSEKIVERTGALSASLRRLLAESARFETLSHEPTIVLTGRPNAGKSTLLNRLAGRPRAVVSPVAGTTRDLLWAHTNLRRGTVKLIDTAGLESDVASEPGPMAEIRRQMHEKAMQAVAGADVLVIVHAADDPRPAPRVGRPADIDVMTKSELAGGKGRDASLAVSAVTGQGMEELRSRLDELAFGAAGGESLSLNARHRQQIEIAIAALDETSRDLADELVAQHLRSALDALGEITGLVSVEDVLGRIFSTFCIGK